MTLSLQIAVGGNYVAEVRGSHGKVIASIGPNVSQAVHVHLPSDAMPFSIVERPATAVEIKLYELGCENKELREKIANLGHHTDKLGAVPNDALHTYSPLAG